jgi:hypothetical protein
LPEVTVPVTFLLKAGILIELYIRVSAWVINVLTCVLLAVVIVVVPSVPVNVVLGNSFSVYVFIVLKSCV